MTLLAPIDHWTHTRIPLDSGTVVPYYGTLCRARGAADEHRS